MCCWGNRDWDTPGFALPEGWQWREVGKVFPNPWKWDSTTSDGLEQFSFSGQPLAKKSTVTFRVFTWEVTSLNRQVLSFSSSHCHAGDRWKKIPGTPQRSKADSQSLWTRSWKAHQNPKSCPGQGSEGVPEQAEMLSLGCPLLCSEPARLCLRGGAAAQHGRCCGNGSSHRPALLMLL